MDQRTEDVAQWKMKIRPLLDGGQGKHRIQLVQIGGRCGQRVRRKDIPGKNFPQVRPAETARVLVTIGHAPS